MSNIYKIVDKSAFEFIFLFEICKVKYRETSLNSIKLNYFVSHKNEVFLVVLPFDHSYTANFEIIKNICRIICGDDVTFHEVKYVIEHMT